MSTPRTALLGTSLVIDAVVTQTGYAGETVSLDIEDEGRIVGSQEVKLPQDGEPAAVRVRFTASDAGPRVFRFRIAPRPGELVTQNNARDALIDVARSHASRSCTTKGSRGRRWRSSTARSTTTRTSRSSRCSAPPTTSTCASSRSTIPISSSAGFPKTREELFAYRGLMLGSVEAGAFTGDQLRMIGEFVERRGGGLLVLGGPRSFAEGGYAGTPVADALPVVTRAAGAGRRATSGRAPPRQADARRAKRTA